MSVQERDLHDHFQPRVSKVEDGESEEESFKKIYEGNLHELKEGEVVRGQVVQVGPEYVTVDIGFKSEGQVPLKEFMKDGTPAVAVGDSIDVLIERKESEVGMVTLSKEKAARFKFWEEISKAWNEDQVVEGKITSRINGGLNVDIGVPAFLPGSQIDIGPVRNLDKLIGSTLKFKIIRLNRRRGNVVLSRRILLEKEREALRGQTNERNLDLAQAMRRAGMNVLYFDYRGTWGSGGEFLIAHALEDVAKAVERARSEEWASAYRADPDRVALLAKPRWIPRCDYGRRGRPHRVPCLPDRDGLKDLILEIQTFSPQNTVFYYPLYSTTFGIKLLA